jgi:hypothetical protein
VSIPAIKPCWQRDPADRCEICQRRARGEPDLRRPWDGGPLPTGGPSELAAHNLLEKASSGYLERWAAAAAERIRAQPVRCCCADGGLLDSAGRCQRCFGWRKATS